MRRERLWRSAAQFLCDSKFLRRQAVEIGFPEHKTAAHYIGIDLTFFQPPPPGKRNQSVLFVARLVEKKGCTYLIRAMQEVQARFPCATLTIVGDGPERPALEIQARELNVKCEFKGAQPGSVIREELTQARVFCVPSIRAKTGDSEGLGIVFAEAQAMGVPVVSTKHGGIPEVVCDEKTGLLAPERDSSALAKHIIRFFSDEDFWRCCSSRAATWISKNFDVRRQTERLEDVYERVIHSR